ncbi:hypothetical protein KAW96_08190 [candidate division WOR-3 bacterium]|nr:hypothetical protein [candidate division WOR-3 bacterium]
MQNLKVDFERYYRDKGSEEIVEGTIYYQTPWRITVIVKKPLLQWIVFNKKGIDIYYPTERKAFRFKTQKPVSLQFFQAFLGVVKKDYGLIDMGYTLYSRKIEGDTVFTQWFPPKVLSKVLGVFKLIYVSDKLVYAESKKADGAIMSKSFYSNHIQHSTTFFPLEISKVRYINADSTFEKITYINPQFNIDFPKDVTDFSISTDVKIKEIEW